MIYRHSAHFGEDYTIERYCIIKMHIIKSEDKSLRLKKTDNEWISVNRKT